ncbi:MAG: hypothetical protein WD156_00520 [Acidimicrobiia bacterium]
MTSFRNTVRTAAVAVGILSVSVAGAGWMMLSGIQRLDASGITSPETFETLRRTVDISVSTTSTVGDALADLEVLIATVASSADTTADFVGETAEVTSTRIPQSLDAIERAMPALIDAAAVIDDALGTLSLLGVDYDPETSFDDALRDVQSSLDGLADEVSAQGAALEGMVPEMEKVSSTATSLTSRVQDTRAHLRSAGTLLSEYRAILDTTEEALAPELGTALRHGPWVQIVLLVIAFTGIALAVSMWKLGDGPAAGDEVWRSS